MQIKTISSNDALAVASRQEDHFFDRKAAAIKGAKLQKAAVAFANADGGELFVGVADADDEPDPSKRWQGVPNIEDFNQHIQALSEVQPALPMELAFLRAEGAPHYVLQVQVEKSQSVHTTSDGTVYERKVLSPCPLMIRRELQPLHSRRAPYPMRILLSAPPWLRTSLILGASPHSLPTIHHALIL